MIVIPVSHHELKIRNETFIYKMYAQDRVRSKNADKVTHTKGTLLKQVVIFIPCAPFHK